MSKPPSFRSPLLGLLIASTFAVTAPVHAQSLQGAAKALDAEKIKTIEFSGNGRWFQFGQAPAPSLPWPPFAVSKYVADIDYATAAAQVQITRIQVEEPTRRRPAPTTQWVNQLVHGAYAWNLPAANAAQIPSPQPAAVEERQAEIWSTPQGFLRAALGHNAESKPVKGGVEVSFRIDDKHRYEGKINDKNEVEWIRTWIDTPVLGDTLVETHFSDYRSFNGVQFPAHILRSEGGHPILDLNVEAATANPDLKLAVPEQVSSAKPAAVTVKCTKIAEGVYYLTGGTHHSVAVEQKDHVVLIEAPLNEARSQALIDKLKDVAHGKPIKYLINTHAHFDHSGGLRTFVDAGATIVTPKGNEAYYKKIWAAPHRLNPDRLESSHKAAKLETFSAKHVLSDGSRSIEIYPIAGSAHNDAFAFVYLPAEKILVEADAYTPAAADAPLPASPNPYSVNLYDNIKKLKLDVDKIAALHGPRLVRLDDLRAAIGQSPASAAK
jgi:glyoxylase-like metal-dependent hydrolase (beta-lactamase superfamily II)